MGIRHPGGSARLAALVVAAGNALCTEIAAAQAPADPPPEFVQVPLTAAMIQSFIATYPTVKATTATIIAKYNADRREYLRKWKGLAEEIVNAI